MKPKFFITTTVARTLFFFKGQPRLWKQDFEVTAIAAEEDRLKEFALAEGIGYNYMPMHREISLWSDFVCLLRFIWFFIKERPYIVHGNTPKASFLSMVAAWITRRPVRIYMCHGLRYQGTQGKLHKLLMTMERISCFCATHVFCVSQGVADIMVKDGLCKKKKINVVGYGSAGGVDLDKYNPNIVDTTVRQDLNIPDKAFVFIFVGRIVKDKGINELVVAFDRLSMSFPFLHLILVGPIEKDLDPVDDKTEILISINKQIHTVGRQNDVRPYLKAADAFVLPSYREGFGMVLIEAGAMGLPCITTNITGCNEIIVPGVNGEIVEPRDADALYDVMNIWVEDKTYVANMALNARPMIINRYDCQKVWKLYYNEYKRLLEKS